MPHSHILAVLRQWQQPTEYHKKYCNCSKNSKGVNTLIFYFITCKAEGLISCKIQVIQVILQDFFYHLLSYFYFLFFSNQVLRNVISFRMPNTEKKKQTKKKNKKKTTDLNLAMMARLDLDNKQYPRQRVG